MAELKHSLSLMCDDETLEMLDRLVKADCSNRSAVIRKAVRRLHDAEFAAQSDSLFLGRDIPESITTAR